MVGVRQRHGRGCKRKQGCDCPWQAEVYSSAEGKKIRKLFADPASAASWRRDAKRKIGKGHVVATGKTVREAWYEWEGDAERGIVRNKTGEQYKPSALRGYADTFRIRIEPALGDVKLAALSRREVQDWIDGLIREERWSSSTVSGALDPLRLVCKRAVEREEIAVNPTIGVRLPAVRVKGRRTATAEECLALLAPLPQHDQAIWATMMLAGLRRGEAQALRIQDVNGTVDVEQSWDRVKGPVAPKSRQGKRRVPVAKILRGYLDAHKTGWSEGLIFGEAPDVPFIAQSLVRRADRAWTAAKLQPITPHECRHTFASLMIAAGVNAKALSEFMGHANIGITMDLYGHLMPGAHDEAAGLLDAYLDAA
jgi:integrase